MTVIISIDGDGLTLKKEISFQKAGQIIAFLGAEENPQQVENRQLLVSTPKVLDSVDQSPKELILQSKAKTNAQKITVLGNYLMDQDGTEFFLIKEVQLQLKKLGEEPSHFKRDLGTAISLKYVYVIDSGENKYGVSEKGKEAIQNQFSGESRIRTGGKKVGVFKKSIPPREEVISLMITTELDGFPNFHSLRAKNDSILWVLAYADSQNIESLTPREVEFLTDKLKNKIFQKDFAAHNKRNIKKGYVSITDGKFKLQHKGIELLKGLVHEETETADK